MGKENIGRLGTKGRKDGEEQSRLGEIRRGKLRHKRTPLIGGRPGGNRIFAGVRGREGKKKQRDRIRESMDTQQKKVIN